MKLKTLIIIGLLIAVLIPSVAASPYITPDTITETSIVWNLTKLPPGAIISTIAFDGGTLTTDALGNVYVVSDESVKTNIKTNTNGLSGALNTNPITFQFKPESGLDTQNTYSGFSAQNLLTSIPDAVTAIPETTKIQVIKIPEQKICDIDAGEKICRIVSAEYETKLIPKLDEKGNQIYTYGINDRALIAASINAIKELNAKIEKQDERIKTLEKLLEEKG